MTMKDILIQKINVEAYRAARDSDCEEIGEESSEDFIGTNEQTFLKKFREVGFLLYHRLNRRDYIAGITDNDVKVVLEEMKKTLNEIGKLPVISKSYGEGSISIGPIVAAYYGLKSGDYARLTIDNVSGIEREVQITKPRINELGELIGIGIYDFDLQRVLGLDAAPNQTYVFNCNLEKIRGARPRLRERVNMGSI